MSAARRTALAAVAVTLLTGCFSEHVAAPVGEVSFSRDVEPILSGSCAFSGCHGTGGANPSSKPMVLASGQAYDAIVGVASAQVPALSRIAPGAPDGSYLIHKLQGTHVAAGGRESQMPLGQPPLNASVIETMRRWVSEGARRN